MLNNNYTQHSNIEGNYYNKYETKNPIGQKLMASFFDSFKNLLCEISFKNIYEAGCGEGHIAKHVFELYPNVEICASDVSESKILEARARVPKADFSVESIYEIPTLDNSFDLAIAMEVLEHLEYPEKGLEELLRITSKYVIISVPDEPIWRACNIARGKYINHLGNTPGHIQHWNKKKFCNFVEKHCSIINVKSPFPWTMLLCEKK